MSGSIASMTALRVEARPAAAAARGCRARRGRAPSDAHQRQQLRLRRRRGQPMAERLDADLAQALLLAADVDREAGSSPTSTVASPGTTPRRARRATRCPDLAPHRRRHRLAVDRSVPRASFRDVQRRSIAVPSGGEASRGALRAVLESARMIVGVPREIKAEENRVALTPSGAGALVAHGHRGARRARRRRGVASPRRALSRRRRHARRRAARCGTAPRWSSR